MGFPAFFFFSCKTVKFCIFFTPVNGYFVLLCFLVLFVRKISLIYSTGMCTLNLYGWPNIQIKLPRGLLGHRYKKKIVKLKINFRFRHQLRSKIRLKIFT